MGTAADVVAAYWAAAQARDWDRFANLLDERVVYEAPQTRERVRGKDAYLRFNIEGFPGEWQISVVRIVGEEDQAASWIEFTRPGQDPETGLTFFRLDGGLISHITDFWPEPYDLPASRAHLVERY